MPALVPIMRLRRIWTHNGLVGSYISACLNPNLVTPSPGQTCVIYVPRYRTAQDGVMTWERFSHYWSNAVLCFICCSPEQAVEPTVRFRWFQTPWHSRTVTVVPFFLYNEKQCINYASSSTTMTTVVVVSVRVKIVLLMAWTLNHKGLGLVRKSLANLLFVQ